MVNNSTASLTGGQYLLTIYTTLCSLDLQSKCSCGREDGGSSAVQVI